MAIIIPIKIRAAITSSNAVTSRPSIVKTNSSYQGAIGGFSVCSAIIWLSFVSKFKSLFLGIKNSLPGLGTKIAEISEANLYVVY